MPSLSGILGGAAAILALACYLLWQSNTAKTEAIATLREAVAEAQAETKTVRAQFKASQAAMDARAAALASNETQLQELRNELNRQRATAERDALLQPYAYGVGVHDDLRGWMRRIGPAGADNPRAADPDAGEADTPGADPG